MWRVVWLRTGVRRVSFSLPRLMFAGCAEVIWFVLPCPCGVFAARRCCWEVLYFSLFPVLLTLLVVGAVTDAFPDVVVFCSVGIRLWFGPPAQAVGMYGCVFVLSIWFSPSSSSIISFVLHHPRGLASLRSWSLAVSPCVLSVDARCTPSLRFRCSSRGVCFMLLPAYKLFSVELGSWVCGVGEVGMLIDLVASVLAVGFFVCLWRCVSRDGDCAFCLADSASNRMGQLVALLPRFSNFLYLSVGFFSFTSQWPLLSASSEGGFSWVFGYRFTLETVKNVIICFRLNQCQLSPFPGISS